MVKPKKKGVIGAIDSSSRVILRNDPNREFKKLMTKFHDICTNIVSANIDISTNNVAEDAPIIVGQ